MMIKNIWLIIIGLVAAFPGIGQKGVEIGGWLGTTYYFGDLNTELDLSAPGPGGGIIYRYNFNKRLALKFSGNVGLVNADDANSDNFYEQNRNLHFRSLILDGSLQFEFNFLPYIHGSGDQSVTPYLFGGLSGMNFNPQAKYMDRWVNLQPLGTEGQPQGEEYTKISYGFNYGFGLKFDLTYNWSMNIELSSRYIYTDYLDDVSTTYPNMSVLASQRDAMAVELSDPSTTIPKLGDPGRQRGNSKDNDSYTFIGIGLLYYIGRIDCPAISDQ